MRVRQATAADAGLLALMLREAAHWRPDREAPPLEVVLADPAEAHYVEVGGDEGSATMVLDLPTGS